MISFLKLLALGDSPVGKMEITDVNSIAELRAIKTGNNGYGSPFLEDGSIVNVDGYYSQNDGGGGIFIFSAYSASADDGGITIAPTSGLGRWVRQCGTEINVRWFGAKGDGATNDTAAINAAIVAASDIYFPAGTYLITGASSQSLDGVNITTSNKILHGDGDSSVIKKAASSQYAVSINRYNGGTSDPTANVKNIVFENLRFLGTCDVDGFSEQKHLLNINAASFVTVRNCSFVGAQGDSIYVGSGNEAAIERHNQNITVENCFFDGINNENRNAISFIDCDGGTVSNCKFQNHTKSTMPGAIDVEPDSLFNICRSINVSGNYFFNIGGNAAVVAFVFQNLAYTIEPNQFLVTDNYFLSCVNAGSCVTGSRGRVADPTDADAPNVFLVTGNSVKSCAALFSFFGCKRITLKDNDANTCAGTCNLGFNTVGSNCRDVLIENNRFVACASTQQIALQIFGVVNCTLRKNIFNDCGNGAVGSYAVDFNTGTSSYVSFDDNIFVTPTAKTLVAIQKEAAHTFTSSTNRFASNVLNGLANSFVAAGAQNLPGYYAEGSWTPTIEGDAGTNVNTYTLQDGYYVRVGNLVTCFFKIIMTAKDAGFAGGVQIGGLPFTAKDNAGQGLYSGALAYIKGIDWQVNYTQLGIAAVRTLTKARIYMNGDNVVGAQITAAMVVPTVELVGQITYPI